MLDNIGYNATPNIIKPLLFGDFRFLRGVSITSEKNFCFKSHCFWSTSNSSLGNLGYKIIQDRLLIEDIR